MINEISDRLTTQGGTSQTFTSCRGTSPSTTRPSSPPAPEG